MASIKKDPKTKKWFYVFSYYDEAGNRKQKKQRGFDTKKEAQIACYKAEEEIKNGSLINTNKITVSTFFEEWFEERKLNKEKITIYVQQSIFQNNIKPYIGNLELQKLNPILCQKFINTLSEKGLAPSTVTRAAQLVKVALDRAVELKLIKKNHMKTVKLPKKNKPDINVWDVDQINHFLKTTKESKYYCAYALALLTGMRQGEILGLRWSDISFEDKLIYIRQTLTYFGKEFKKGGKTNSSERTISISDKLISILKEERKKVVEQKLKLGKEYKDNDLVICSNDGENIPPRTLRRNFKRDVLKSGLPEIRFHDLRHSHATMLIKQNVNVKLIQERLGHKTIDTTLNVYSHVIPSMQQQLAKEIDKMIELDNEYATVTKM